MELLKRGFKINDRDTSTDMNLLHYVAKSGASGIGDINVSLKTAKMLIEKGIHVNAKCRWTDMSALHYSVFFDVHRMVQLLLQTDHFSGMQWFSIDQYCTPNNMGMRPTITHKVARQITLGVIQLGGGLLNCKQILSRVKGVYRLKAFAKNPSCLPIKNPILVEDS